MYQPSTARVKYTVILFSEDAGMEDVLSAIENNLAEGLRKSKHVIPSSPQVSQLYLPVWR